MCLSNPKSVKPRPQSVGETLKSSLQTSGEWRLLGRTLDRHLENDFGVISGKLDATLFYKQIQEHIAGSCATCVDDRLHVGNEEYCTRAEETEQNFKFEPKQFDNMQVAEV